MSRTYISKRLLALFHYSRTCSRYRRRSSGAAVGAPETEATEIMTNAKEFIAVVEQWIAKNHPSLTV
jgi:hypothetical protein